MSAFDLLQASARSITILCEVLQEADDEVVSVPHHLRRAELTIEERRRSAERVALCMLASAKAEIGDLSRRERFVRIFGMVNASEDFAQSPKVVDGFSNVMTTAFGEGGKAARAAIVVQSLPDRIPVEVEAIALLRPEPTA